MFKSRIKIKKLKIRIIFLANWLRCLYMTIKDKRLKMCVLYVYVKRTNKFFKIYKKKNIETTLLK